MIVLHGLWRPGNADTASPDGELLLWAEDSTRSGAGSGQHPSAIPVPLDGGVDGAQQVSRRLLPGVRLARDDLVAGRVVEPGGQ